MVLGGLALAFSRLIDNSVVVLENIFRHLELGEDARRPRRKGRPGSGAAGAGRHLHHRHCLLPGDLLYGVSRFLFTALALAVVLSLFASYSVAMTVVPLFCARFIKSAHGDGRIDHAEVPSFGRFVTAFNRRYRPDADALRPSPSRRALLVR